MVKTTRTRVVIAILAMVGAGLAACSKDDEPAANTAGPIKIGISLPLGSRKTKR